MNKKNYRIIPITKPIDGKELLDNVVIYLYSRLKECQIETNINENIYTILVSSTSKRKQGKLAYITIEIILHSDSCSVSFTSSKDRPRFNFALAIVAIPVSSLLSGMLAGTGLLRLWNLHAFKKDVIKYIETYVFH